MTRNLFVWGLGVAVVILLVTWTLSFRLMEGYTAVVTLFGNPVRVIRDAGLHAKWPRPIERAIILDTRRRVYSTRFRETLTRDKKNIILLTYAIWSVDDPLRFLESVGNTEAAELKLDGMVSNAKNAVMGKYELTALVSTNPQDLRIDEIEQSILDEVAGGAKEKLGVMVFQIGIKQMALPEENVRYVFQQMRAERSQFSAKAVAEGKRESQAIIDETDLKKAEILAKAMEESAVIRGEAEAEAARLYAEAQRQDPAFYKWHRSLDSLKQMLKSNATLIMRTDSAPFDVLRKGPALERDDHAESRSPHPRSD